MGHLFHSLAYAFSANAASLHPAVRHMVGAEGGDIIDGHATKIQVFDSLPDLSDIPAEHASLQTVTDVIRLVQGFLEVVKGHSGFLGEPCFVVGL
jgi:hypothetical protein